MNCIEFQKEFDSASAPVGEYGEHLASCERCSEFVGGEKHLSDLLRQLPKTSAPQDFEFAVRSGIARKKSIGSKTWAVAKVAIPGLSFVLIAGFVYLNFWLVDENTLTPNLVELREVNQPTTLNEAEQPVEVEPSEEAVGKPADTVNKKDDTRANNPRNSEIAGVRDSDGVAPPAERNPIAPRVQDSDSNLSGSQDFGVEAPPTINPPGIDPDKPIDRKQRVQTQSFTAEEVLRALGISTSRKNGKLKVVSVAKSSLGERAGVKAGDLMISIDGKAIGKKAFTVGTARGKFLKVSRNGREILIDIGSAN